MSDEVHDESIIGFFLGLRDRKVFVILLDVWLAQWIPRVAKRG